MALQNPLSSPVDIDDGELAEWRDSVDAVVAVHGPEAAARVLGAAWHRVGRSGRAFGARSLVPLTAWDVAIQSRRYALRRAPLDALVAGARSGDLTVV